MLQRKGMHSSLSQSSALVRCDNTLTLALVLTSTDGWLSPSENDDTAKVWISKAESYDSSCDNSCFCFQRIPSLLELIQIFYL